jgi:hypothetical protein
VTEQNFLFLKLLPEGGLILFSKFTQLILFNRLPLQRSDRSQEEDILNFHLLQQSHVI